MPAAEVRALNPSLYAALKRRFEKIIFAQQGQSASPAFPSAFSTRTGLTKVGTDRSLWGEYYRVCCPYCRDGGFRLWINHLYGTKDDHGRESRHLAICYNEDCLANTANRNELYESLYGLVNKNNRDPVVILSGEESTDFLARVPAPGQIAPITKVSPRNEARMYLVSRGFDLEYLESNFGVGVVVEADVDYRKAENRVYIPIRMDGELVGWQCRYPGELEWRAHPQIPKYYNLPTMPKKLMLSYWDTAKFWPFLAICEGAISAWRVGPCCVPLLGKTISVPQRQLVAGALGRPIFLLAEEDSKPYWDVVEQELRQDGHQTVVQIMFPGKYDPANYTHEAVVNIMRNAAAQKHLDLITW
jgi:hypothetical protein